MDSEARRVGSANPAEALEKFRADRSALVADLDKQISESRARTATLEAMRAEIVSGFTSAPKKRAAKSDFVDQRRRLGPDHPEFSHDNYRATLEQLRKTSTVYDVINALGWSYDKTKRYILHGVRLGHVAFVGKIVSRRADHGGRRLHTYELTASGREYIAKVAP